MYCGRRPRGLKVWAGADDVVVGGEDKLPGQCAEGKMIEKNRTSQPHRKNIMCWLATVFAAYSCHLGQGT